MEHKINQAVVFTKPLHHLDLPLTPEELGQQLNVFLIEKGFRIILNRKLIGTELSKHKVLKEHYLIYSKASYGDVVVTAEAKAIFESTFGESWENEVMAGRIMGNPQLLKEKNRSAQELYLFWNKQFSCKKTKKLQEGLIIAWIDQLDCYCINAFYPILEEFFYNPKVNLSYYVVEFDPAQTSWAAFRKKILGSTDASKADPQSFRGKLYKTYGFALEYPGRDNFVHGSAGPIEGFIERTVHEPNFDMSMSPVGKYLQGKGITLAEFKRWKSHQTIVQLGEWFNASARKNTEEILFLLDKIQV